MFSAVRQPFAAYAALFFLVLIHHTCSARRNSIYCAPSSCGNIHNISYPFRLKSDPQNCGHKKLELECQNSHAVFYWSAQKYYVQAINYDNFTIRLVDADFQKDNCSSIPLHPVLNDDFYDGYYLPSVASSGTYLWRRFLFITCRNPLRSQIFVDYTSSCNSDTYNISAVSSPSPLKGYKYVMVAGTFSDLEDSCHVDSTVITSLQLHDFTNISYKIIRESMVYGFELSWFWACCESVGENCCNLGESSRSNCIVRANAWRNYGLSTSPFRVVMDSLTRHVLNHIARIWPISRYLNADYDWISYSKWGKSELQFHIPTGNHNYSGIYATTRTISSALFSTIIVLLITLLALIVIYRTILFFCGISCLITLLIYKWRRRHLSMYDDIEEFLQSHDNLMPVRYSYSEIKKLTKGFKDKLGEGGFGSVYKGKLRSGCFAAIKILGKSKANGQDFINEVATIGTIHHVNVVKLIGFTAEGTKRALIYEFMQNGSLDKFIFSKEVSISLSNEKIHEISLGVARGIEYLHQGCEMQILHFDIKPHNILLDENFVPKISDFGLAKLYPTDNSIMSLTAARGTMGYMAPELFYKTIGRVSYKADVYSFGMLLLEMVGRRKNVNALAEHSSQIYFPSWVYDQFSEGLDIESRDATEQERRITKKMIIVALWCIQFRPNDRPSMHKVVDMLESEVDFLLMPPKPFLTPSEMPREDGMINIVNPISLTHPSNDSIDTSYQFGR